MILLALAACSATAQTGRSAYEFLDVPTSSHAFALGGGGIALIDDDVALAQENPALLGQGGRQAGGGELHALYG